MPRFGYLESLYFHPNPQLHLHLHLHLYPQLNPHLYPQPISISVALPGLTRDNGWRNQQYHIRCVREKPLNQFQSSGSCISNGCSSHRQITLPRLTNCTGISEL